MKQVDQRPTMTGNIYIALLVGGLARVLLVVYGVWQDKTMVVKFTDVDYEVFTDAARYVTQGQSPYERATYRYTPLLAMALTPNILLTPIFGKLLFIVFDLLAGCSIYLILRSSGHAPSTASRYTCLWLFNPLPIVVCSRGNAESIMAFLVLASVYCLHEGGGGLRAGLGFVLYAVSVHVKLYPVTYLVVIYLRLTSNHTWRLFGVDLLPNRRRLAFVLIAGLTFGLLTGGCYMLYGDVFLQETYMYHLTRRDTRHNFSLYFYLLYLVGESSMAKFVGLVVFLPQVALLAVSSFRYHRDLPFSCFLHTFIFVTFNKVCTSQYFLWYLCLLPVIVPRVKMSIQRTMCIAALWFAGQGLWLIPAYYLEFEGQNTFSLIWLAGLIFFAINVYIINTLITHYDFTALRKVSPQAESTYHTPSRFARRPIHSKED